MNGVLNLFLNKTVFLTFKRQMSKICSAKL